MLKCGTAGLTLATAMLSVQPVLLMQAGAAEFYEGKTLTIMNNYPPGGGSDIDGRIFARHLSKYIPGHPKIVFKNMAGAGGLTAFNWLGEVAKPDGFTTCYYTWNPVVQIIGDPKLRVPFNKFVFVAGTTSPVVAFIRKDVAPGINGPSDFLKAHDFKIGGLSDDALHDVRHRLSLDMLLGPVYGNVTGFAGFAPLFKAMQQDEVQFSSSSLPGYFGAVVPTMVKTGIVVPVFQYETASTDGKFSANPAVPDLPTWIDLYREKFGRDSMPSGIKWEAYKLLNVLYTNLLRTVLLPPGSPKEAAIALATGFEGAVKDSEFMAEFEKVIQAPAELIGREAGEKVVAQLGGIDPKVSAFLQDYVAHAH
jgi:tripartite-type tricarboxylate transporter receptor subunit TctC